MEEVEVVTGSRVFIGADEHFFCAAATGDEADADFDEADVGFRGGVYFRGVQTDFAAAAEGHALRRRDDRLRRVLDGEIDVLELLHGHVQFVPLLLLRADKDEHEVGANGKIGCLIGDDHAVAEIDEAGAGVAFDFATGLFKSF